MESQEVGMHEIIDLRKLNAFKVACLVEAKARLDRVEYVQPKWLSGLLMTREKLVVRWKHLATSFFKKSDIFRQLVFVYLFKIQKMRYIEIEISPRFLSRADYSIHLTSHIYIRRKPMGMLTII